MFLRDDVLCARAEHMDGGCQAHRSTDHSMQFNHRQFRTELTTPIEFSTLKLLKVKFSLCALWRLSGREDVQFNTFLTSALDGEKW